jgi:hypothetical protein
MPLSLNLSASDAKVARARVHLETLQQEIPVAIARRKPYTPRLSGINPNSGWCTLFLSSTNGPEHGLAVIVGELVHDLRCAVDYIIPELVRVSGATLGTQHQFPIYTSQVHYGEKVGTAAIANPRGPLGEINHGLKEIFDLQPFHKQPDPEGHRLALVQQFSNADKHRIISAVAPVPQAFSGMIEEGEVLEEWKSPKLPEWKPNVEYEIARLRFAKPYPPTLTLNATVSVEIFFETPPFGRNVSGSRIDIGVLQEMCEDVAGIVDRFKKL